MAIVIYRIPISTIQGSAPSAMVMAHQYWYLACLLSLKISTVRRLITDLHILCEALPFVPSPTFTPLKFACASLTGLSLLRPRCLIHIHSRQWYHNRTALELHCPILCCSTAESMARSSVIALDTRLFTAGRPFSGDVLYYKVVPKDNKLGERPNSPCSVSSSECTTALQCLQSSRGPLMHSQTTKAIQQ